MGALRIRSIVSLTHIRGSLSVVRAETDTPFSLNTTQQRLCRQHLPG